MLGDCVHQEAPEVANVAALVGLHAHEPFLEQANAADAAIPRRLPLRQRDAVARGGQTVFGVLRIFLSTILIPKFLIN